MRGPPPFLYLRGRAEKLTREEREEMVCRAIWSNGAFRKV